MRNIPAFSKKSSAGPTVGGGGQRGGFTDHVKSTNAGKPKAIKNMAGFQGKGSTLGGGSTVRQPHHPSFKSHSGSAGKSVAAFSKKKI